MRYFNPAPFIAVAAVVAFAAGPAAAHARLVSATPAPDSTVAATRTLTLTFSETVEPRFSQVTLQGPDGQPIGVPAFTPSANGKTLTIPLPNLPPGDYRLSWRVISVDTHRTEGRFTFTVRP